MYQETHQTPFGWLTVHSNGQGVTHLDWALNGIDDDRQADDVSRETWKQINNYCSGDRKSLMFRSNLKPALRSKHGSTSCEGSTMARLSPIRNLQKWRERQKPLVPRDQPVPETQYH